MISKSKYILPLLEYSGSMLNISSEYLNYTHILMYANIIGVQLQCKTIFISVELKMKTWHQIFKDRNFKK